MNNKMIKLSLLVFELTCLLINVNGGGYSMSEFRRQLMSLPHYNELEYLQGDGTAYINTNHIRALSDVIRFKSNNYIPIHYDCAFGARVKVTQGYSYNDNLNMYYNNGKVTIDNATRLEFPNSSIDSVEVIVGNNYVEFNGTKTNHTAKTQSGVLPLFLFAENRNGTVTLITKASINYFKIDGVMDLTPVKRSVDGELGFFDKISGIFFTNANTSGKFIAGSETGIKY